MILERVSLHKNDCATQTDRIIYESGSAICYLQNGSLDDDSTQHAHSERVLRVRSSTGQLTSSSPTEIMPSATPNLVLLGSDGNNLISSWHQAARKIRTIAWAAWQQALQVRSLMRVGGARDRSRSQTTQLVPLGTALMRK